MEIAGSKIEVHVAQNDLHLRRALHLNDAGRVHVYDGTAIVLNSSDAVGFDADKSVCHRTLDRVVGVVPIPAMFVIDLTLACVKPLMAMVGDLRI